MSVNNLAILICAIKTLISPGQWDQETCKEHAEVYTQVANKYKLDPLLLVSINIHECDMQDYKDVTYNNSQGIYARDVCPMGLRVRAESRPEARGAKFPNQKTINLAETRGGLSRQEVIDKAAKLLISYKKYHIKHCQGLKHSYLLHYNVGYQKLNNDYDKNLLEIYYSLKSGKSTLYKPLNERTREISKNIRKITSHEIHKDPMRGCKPRSSCIVAKR